MADADQDNLTKLRDSMVEYRRAAAEKVNEGDYLRAADNVVDMQQKIEIIDRAIADERRIAIQRD